MIVVPGRTEGLALARAAGDRMTEGNILNNSGVHHMEAGRLAQATACFGGALELYRTVGNRHGVVNVMLNLAVIEETVGRFEAARTLYDQVLRECDEVGAFGLKGMACANVAGVLAELGEGAAARAAAAESLRMAVTGADRRTEAFARRGARMAARTLSELGDGAAAREQAESVLAERHADLVPRERLRNAAATWREIGAAWAAHAGSR